jgi:uncharacterized metal-binding protein
MLKILSIPQLYSLLTTEIHGPVQQIKSAEIFLQDLQETLTSLSSQNEKLFRVHTFY